MENSDLLWTVGSYSSAAEKKALQIQNCFAENQTVKCH